MNTPRAILSFGLGIALTQLGRPAILIGQSVWAPVEHQRTVGIEVIKPFFVHDDGLSAVSSITHLSVSWPLSDKAVFVGELPLAYGGWKNAYVNQSDLALGNPYLGLQLGREESNFTGRLGVRLPLVPGDAWEDNVGVTVGYFGNVVGRPDAFLMETVPISAVADFRTYESGGVSLALCGGAMALVPTKSAHMSGEMMALYGARAGFRDEAWSVSGGFAGAAMLTEGGSLADRTIHEIGIDAGYVKRRVQPSLFVRVPVDNEVGDYLNVLVGLGLRTRF